MASRSVTVDGFTIKETAFGGAVVNYCCPDCEGLLRSPISDIGKDDNCPNCQCSFSVPGEKALKAYKKILKDDEKQAAIEIQKKAEIKKQEKAKADADAADTAGCFGIGMLMLLPPVLVAGYIDSQADGNNVFLPVFLVACVVWMSILSPIVGSMGSSRPRSSTARSIDNLTTYLVIRDIADRNSENNDFD